jgi:RimJ/RimL family protein N-acetyltransferase
MIVLTPSTHIDADFIVAAESDAETSRFIIPWARERHLDAMKDTDCAHLIIRHSETAERLGFFMLFGVTSRNRTIELRRIVIVNKGAGIGRAALRGVKALAFGRLEAHRLWLDVKSKNQRARHLYESEGFLEEGVGFLEEGVMRECLLEDDGFESLVLMSIEKGARRVASSLMRLGVTNSRLPSCFRFSECRLAVFTTGRPVHFRPTLQFVPHLRHYEDDDHALTNRLDPGNAVLDRRRGRRRSICFR